MFVFDTPKCSVTVARVFFQRVMFYKYVKSSFKVWLEFGKDWLNNKNYFKSQACPERYVSYDLGLN